MSGRNVKGTLFVDYVRMLRGHKTADWSAYLTPEDMTFLQARIEPAEWYPMETFERMGVAILDVVARGDLIAVREWGRLSIDWLCLVHPNLTVPGEPRESLMRFKVLRESFFDFPALEIDELNDNDAIVSVSYGMGTVAEEAASQQTAGFFERLLQASGATNVQVWFSAASWTGDATTRIQMSWK